ncbi:MAG: hypothetical protein N2440_00140 [Actinobacteria bacterium]|nr:hypothetical protein [Actinomycetota bacterium]
MLHLKRSMDRKQHDDEKKIGLSDLVLGIWLLSHDLADRAIHSLKDAQESTIFGELISAAHQSEDKLKSVVKTVLSEIGLATKKELKEVEERIALLEKKRR